MNIEGGRGRLNPGLESSLAGESMLGRARLCARKGACAGWSLGDLHSVARENCQVGDGAAVGGATKVPNWQQAAHNEGEVEEGGRKAIKEAVSRDLRMSMVLYGVWMWTTQARL